MLDFLLTDPLASSDVTFLCTKPEYAGKGTGTMLLKKVMNQAAADKLPVILESTMNAMTFYEKLGFHVAESLELMLPPRGSSEATERYEERCMVWGT